MTPARKPPLQFGLAALLWLMAGVAAFAGLAVAIPKRHEEAFWGLLTLATPFVAVVAGAWLVERFRPPID